MSQPELKQALNRAVSLITRQPITLLAGSAAVTLGLYGQAMTLPVFHDDAVVMRAVDGASLPQILTSGIGLAYYRPASLAIWKIYELIAGGAWPEILHLHNLILFLLCGWLVGLMARRLSPDRAAMPWLAMVFFLCFPFNYQAVTWASADVHLQVAAGTLGALLLVDQWWETGRAWALILAWVCLAFAVFSHESGVLAAPLMAGWLINRAARNGGLRGAIPHWRRLAIPLIPAGVIALAYAVSWLSVPRVSNSNHVTLASSGWNAAYFSQGLGFPAAPLGGILAGTGVDGVLAAGIAAVGAIGALGAVAWATRERTVWLGIGWYAVGVSIAAVALPSSYVVDGPRLMLLGSIGAALAWAGVASGLWERLRGSWRIIPAGIAALCVAVGAGFVIGRMALHERMAGIYNTLIREIDPTVNSVVVNLPAWIAPDARVFALGNEGVAYMADYYPLTLLFWANTGLTPKLRRLVAEDITPELDGYTAGLVGGTRPPSRVARVKVIQGESAVYVVTAVDQRWQVVQATRADGRPPAQPSTFANGIQVDGQARVDADRSEVTVSLVWHVAQPAAATPFIHLMCGDTVGGQADGAPLAGLYPFDQWRAGETWIEERVMSLGGRRIGECRSVRIGLIDGGSGEPILTQDGKPYIELPVPVTGHKGS